MTSPEGRVAASFRDPSGFLFRRQGRLLRQINQCYRPHYEQLMSSGLYQHLVERGLLVPHQEVSLAPQEPESHFKTIEPETIPFLSWPYEWCFSQLKEAARTTMRIQLAALQHDMILKDASAYNIQFLEGRPILIDTLSFETYREGEPWVAYRQFCQHFLAPLALASRRDVRLLELLRVYLDGIPLDLASRLLPLSSHWRPALASHIHLHARSQRRWAAQPHSARVRPVGRFAYRGLMEGLASAVESLPSRIQKSEWLHYYQHTNYTAAAFQGKLELVTRFLERLRPATVWDLGGNVGRFSRLAAERGARTVCLDMDPAAVEANYLEVKRNREKRLLPLVVDLTNPSPPLGWHNRERQSLEQRGPADLVLALALIHHLAIAGNVPLPEIARFLGSLGRHLLVEFVPKKDSQVQRLLAARRDIFEHYSEEDFERAFAPSFHILERAPIPGSCRTLYLMARR